MRGGRSAGTLLVFLASGLLAGCGTAGDVIESIVFAAALDGDASRELYSIQPDGTGLTRLTTTDASDEYAPRWSPDGERIAYVDDDGIHVMNADGSDGHLVFEAEAVSGMDW